MKPPGLPPSHQPNGRRQILTAMAVCGLLLEAWVTSAAEPSSDPRWMRATAAIYQMMLATETTSHGVALDSRPRRFSGLSSTSASQRLALKDFKRLAKEYPMPGFTRGDRRKLDDNLWQIVQHAHLRTALHLHEQWGSEGRYRLRNRQNNVAHVASCSFCRPIYQNVTRESQLTCGSEHLGYQEPTRIDTPNKWVP